MKSPVRAPRHSTAYKWHLHHARCDGYSKSEAHRVAMERTKTRDRDPAVCKTRSLDRRGIRKVCARQTKAEKRRELKRKVERSGRLMRQLMIAQKRGEDTSKIVELARSQGIEVDDANGNAEQKREDEYPHAKKVFLPEGKIAQGYNTGRRLVFGESPPSDDLESEL